MRLPELTKPQRLNDMPAHQVIELYQKAGWKEWDIDGVKIWGKTEHIARMKALLLKKLIR
jgi:hypothetical protein